MLKKLDMVKDLDIDKWVDDSFVREAFKQSSRDYDAQLADFSNYQVQGNDTLCNVPISDPLQAGQIWAQGGKVVSFSSTACTLEGVNAYRAQGRKIEALRGLVTLVGIALLFWTGMFWPGVLILLGVIALLSPEIRPHRTA